MGCRVFYFPSEDQEFCIYTAGSVQRNSTVTIMTTACEAKSYGLTDPRSLLCFLQDADVRLVRLEYLIELLESGRTFPRRQEAENETTASGAPALVDAKELNEVRINDESGHLSTMIQHPTPRPVTVRLVSVSHVWESMQHPDPWRFACGKGSGGGVSQGIA